MISPFAIFPALSDSMLDLVRIGYGVLLLATLMQVIPQARRFFMSERWGGYAKSSPVVDAVENPIVMPLILAAWFAAALCLVLNRWTIAAAALNLVLAHYYFVQTRWKSVVRGMGAPGLMTYWIAFALFLLECARAFAPDLRSLALLVVQADFALIILSAGVYKFTAGYPRNHGMELGMVNPEWGYWWRAYKALPPSHWVFRVLNHLAWGTEVAAALLMLIPSTRFPGGLLIIGSFLFIATQIRLGFLCEMVMVCGLLFAHPGSFVDQIAVRLLHSGGGVTTVATAIHPVLNIFLWTYLICLPIAHAGMYYNFYARKRLTPVVQGILERYTNFFGMIIWRVFSVDVVNFFVDIYAENPATRDRKLISSWGRPLQPRYNHVAESITVTSLFTTLKYYPSNSDLFRERLLRYARTVNAPGDVLVFKYFSVTKEAGGFGFVPVAEYRVAPDRMSVDTRAIDQTISVHDAHIASPVHEGAVPGSYAPLAS